MRGEIHTARALGERLLRIAKRAEDPALLSRTHTASAFELFSLGDFSAAQAHAEQSIAHYDLRRHKALGAVSADDAVGVSFVVRAFALQIRGYPDQAQASLQKGVAAGRELSLPYAMGGALLSLADLHLLRRESHAVRESAEATINLSTREGFPYYVARATILRGWALADQGEVVAGIAEIRRGLGPFERWERFCGHLAVSVSWPRRTGKRERPIRGSPRSPKRSRSPAERVSANTRPSFID